MFYNMKLCKNYNSKILEKKIGKIAKIQNLFNNIISETQNLRQKKSVFKNVHKYWNEIFPFMKYPLMGILFREISKHLYNKKYQLKNFKKLKKYESCYKIFNKIFIIFNILKKVLFYGNLPRFDIPF